MKTIDGLFSEETESLYGQGRMKWIRQMVNDGLSADVIVDSV